MHEIFHLKNLLFPHGFIQSVGRFELFNRALGKIIRLERAARHNPNQEKGNGDQCPDRHHSDE